MSGDPARILDVLGAASAIRRFLDGVSQDTFFQDDLRQSAVLHKFTVIGEAAGRVSPSFREAHPEIDWAGIVGFRNRIIHGYDEVDLDIVWQITRDDLPRIVAALEPLVPENPDGQED